jgi:hypothetical protein
MIKDYNIFGDGEMKIEMRKGKEWKKGGSYFKAFKNAYVQVGDNMSKFSKEQGG